MMPTLHTNSYLMCLNDTGEIQKYVSGEKENFFPGRHDLDCVVTLGKYDCSVRLVKAPVYLPTMPDVISLYGAVAAFFTTR